LACAPPLLLPTVGCGWVDPGLGNRKNAKSGNRGARRRGEWMRDLTSANSSGRPRSNGRNV
jgi:hypothetical protein